jgi:hypothetical protein
MRKFELSKCFFYVKKQVDVDGFGPALKNIANEMSIFYLNILEPYPCFPLQNRKKSLWHMNKSRKLKSGDEIKKSSATVFLVYLTGIWKYLRFSLISAVDFYYIINKLIILVPDPH